MPWRWHNNLLRLLLSPWFRLRLRGSGVRWGRGLRLFGAPIVQRHIRSTIQIGDHCTLRSARRSNPIAPNHPVVLSTRTADATIEIGSNFGITGGSIVAQTRVTIGDRVLVGANCLIIDTDFHSIETEGRRDDPKISRSAPIEIGDDVFIGANTTILKGTIIGSGAVIGAGSVVSRDIPSMVVAAGNPAKQVRRLEGPH